MKRKPDPQQGRLFGESTMKAAANGKPAPAIVEETRAAILQVEQNADAEWLETALLAVERTCRKLEYFISDDVWDFGELESTREDRALGPVMMRAKRNGWCVKTDRLRPSRRSHLSGKPVWRSLIAMKEGI
jgi:hypothetical protein